MILEKLSSIVGKHAKLIIIVWILLLVCSVPFMMQAQNKLSYDTSSLAGNNSESVEGQTIISEYFIQSDINMNQVDLIVVEYTSQQGADDAALFWASLEISLGSYVDGDGKEKISYVLPYHEYKDPDHESQGIILYAVIYNADMIDKNLVSGDTGNLRSLISNIISENDYQDMNTYLTGSPALSYDIKNSASEDLAKIDPVSILLILVLVGLFFRSFVTSAMPPITIGAAFGIVMCILYFMGSVLNIFYITEMFLLVSMLGAGCDYCIFILTRYREERIKGLDHDHAFREAFVWGGESIITSGASVIIGFGSMTICSFSLISSMGLMLAIGIIVALLAALTLITSLIALFGEKLFWPSGIKSLQEGGKSTKGWYKVVSNLGQRYFHNSVRFSMKHAKAIIISVILITVPMAYIVMTAQTSYDMIGAMSSGEASEGLNEIGDYTNGGMIMPDFTVMELTESLGTLTISGKIGFLIWNTDEYTTKCITSITSLTDSLKNNDDNIGDIYSIYIWQDYIEPAIVAVGPQEPAETNMDYTLRVYQYIDDNYLSDAAAIYPDVILIELALGVIPMFTDDTTYDNVQLISLMNYAANYMAGSVGGERTVTETSTTSSITFVKITVITKAEAMADVSMDTIHTLNSSITQFEKNNQDLISKTWLTGSAVVMYEISEQVNSEFQKVEILVVVLIFILLFVVMKSYLTPLRSILSILMSIIWTVGLTHLIFGSLLGDGVIWLIPIILLVICLGLGMDYDILLTTRIKENHISKGMTNDEAIEAAVTHSGSVITICGFIMGGAFGALMLSSTTMLIEFGFALCFAILVDALFVRTYVVPAAMHLMGEWNWKGPKFMHKKNQ